ncbi:MAG: glucarate dehydratase [Verrucomicrobia bacterium]|nr:MAG: glucarate dehydratase [Verrucomicrobiota bacterium]
MKISTFRLTPIALTDPPLRAASGLHAPFALRLILELIDGNGVVGISESPCTPAIEQALEAVGPILVGADPCRFVPLLLEVEESLGQGREGARGDAPWDQRVLVHVLSAIEVACLDLAGKQLGRSLGDLLGGRVRDRVPFGAYLFYKHEGAGGALEFGTDPEATGWAEARQKPAMTPDEIVAQAVSMCAAFGFTGIKLKGGVLPPGEERDAMIALRDAFGPDVPLRLDPNGIWKVETSIEIGKTLEGVLEYFEDPTRGQEAMAEVRRALKIPLATNMCTTSFADLPSSVRLGSEDIILSDHHFWGGIRPCIELAKLCQVFGRGVSMHSNSHAGISLAAMVHLGSLIPNLDYALDTHYPWQSEEVISEGRLRFVDGHVAVPEGPGLGVTLDRDALARLHQQYLDCGLTARNDAVEMEKVEPGWTFQKIRW